MHIDLKYLDLFEDLLGDLSLGEEPAALTSKPDIKTGNAATRTTLLNERDLADFWGVSDRQVRMLLSEAVIDKVDGKKYDQSAATKAYIQHLVVSAKRRGGFDPDLKAEKLRLTQAQAEKVEIQNASARGELLRSSEVRTAWAEILRDVRAAMLALPGRIHGRLPHLTPHDVKTIDSEIRFALQESADDNA